MERTRRLKHNNRFLHSGALSEEVCHALQESHQLSITITESRMISRKIS
jgi:hypothetical protein